MGSGAAGFTDELSDLDLCAAVDENQHIKSVMDTVKTAMDSKWDVVSLLEMEGCGLQVLMLNNFLEIDIGYMRSNRQKP